MIFICPHCWVEQELSTQAFSKDLEKARCTVCSEQFNPFENKVKAERASVFRTKLNIEKAIRGYRANILLCDEPGAADAIPAAAVIEPEIDLASLYSEVSEASDALGKSKRR